MFNVHKRAAIGLAALGPALMICAPGLAELSTIRTPPEAALASMSNETTLRELALANLVASNCELSDLTTGDAGLLAGTAQLVAKNMGISTDVYFSSYIHPAMTQIATAAGCDLHADMTRALVKTLKDLGGAVLEE